VLREPYSFPRWHRRYGDVFMLRTGFAPPLTLVADPTLVKPILTADRATVLPGPANGGPLLQLVGPQSLLLLDEDVHLHRRKLMLPPFHGERLRVYEGLMREIADAEIDRWPLQREFALHPSMQTITLRVILRAVFGIDAGDSRFAELERLAIRYLNQGTKPWSLLMAGRELPRYGPWRSFVRTREATDEFLYAEIASRRREPGLEDRDDILSLLIIARDAHGEGLSPVELRDQLMTLLLAGHETTATGLAWTFERLLRNPAVMRRLRADLADGSEEYLGWVVKESLRSRPVVPIAIRYLTEPFPLGDYVAPADSLLAISISLLHRRPDLFPEPEAFRPERFADPDIESYAWLPFGGGVRRCIGASFAMLEMRVVLRRVLERCELVAANPEPERPKRRSVTFAPHRGARVVVSAREAAQRPLAIA
jgi:cytochrome P450